MHPFFIQVIEDAYNWILDHFLPLCGKLWQHVLSQMIVIDEYIQDITELILNNPIVLMLIEMVMLILTIESSEFL